MSRSLGELWLQSLKLLRPDSWYLKVSVPPLPVSAQAQSLAGKSLCVQANVTTNLRCLIALLPGILESTVSRIPDGSTVAYDEILRPSRFISKNSFTFSSLNFFRFLRVHPLLINTVGVEYIDAILEVHRLWEEEGILRLLPDGTCTYFLERVRQMSGRIYSYQLSPKLYYRGYSITEGGGAPVGENPLTYDCVGLTVLAIPALRPQVTLKDFWDRMTLDGVTHIKSLAYFLPAGPKGGESHIYYGNPADSEGLTVVPAGASLRFVSADPRLEGQSWSYGGAWEYGFTFTFEPGLTYRISVPPDTGLSTLGQIFASIPNCMEVGHTYNKVGVTSYVESVSVTCTGVDPSVFGDELFHPEYGLTIQVSDSSSWAVPLL